MASGSVPTYTEERRLTNGLTDEKLLPESRPLTWCVIQARTDSETDPKPKQIMVKIGFGNQQKTWYPTPVTFEGLYQAGGCEPHTEGVRVDVAPHPGIVLVATGGFR